MDEYKRIIDKYYESGSDLRRVLISHSAQVTGLALEIAERKGLPLDKDDVTNAGMLHDIGIVRCHAPGIYCTGDAPYICHGIIGAGMLELEGLPQEICNVAKRHTGAGLSKDDIIAQGLPLPHEDFLPLTLLEKLICYADKFYSKSGDMQRKPLDVVIGQMERHGSDTLSRFMDLHRLFG